MGKQVMKRLGLCLIAVLAAIVVLDAGCVFYKVTGIPCPGCGVDQGLPRGGRAAVRGGV